MGALYFCVWNNFFETFPDTKIIRMWVVGGSDNTWDETMVETIAKLQFPPVQAKLQPRASNEER
jgi:hypothetical protein